MLSETKLKEDSVFHLHWCFLHHPSHFQDNSAGIPTMWHVYSLPHSAQLHLSLYHLVENYKHWCTEFKMEFWSCSSYLSSMASVQMLSSGVQTKSCFCRWKEDIWTRFFWERKIIGTFTANCFQSGQIIGSFWNPVCGYSSLLLSIPDHFKIVRHIQCLKVLPG